jgi:hypothetical protein
MDWEKLEQLIVLVRVVKRSGEGQRGCDLDDDQAPLAPALDRLQGAHSAVWFWVLLWP